MKTKNRTADDEAYISLDDPAATKIGDCWLCNKPIFDAPHKHLEWRKLKLYPGLDLCPDCRKGNWDGFNPTTSLRIEEWCRNNNVPVPLRTKNGWLPLDENSYNAPRVK